MVALLRGHDEQGLSRLELLVGILALPLLPMEWIHATGMFFVLHQFGYDTIHSN
jgi:hypothetical protein